MNVFNPIWSSINGLFKRRNEFSAEDFLKQTPIFSGLSHRELKRVIQLIHYRKYQAEEFVFYKNQPGAAFYVIKSGTLQIIQPTEPPLVLAELKTGEIFGELSILDESPRSASAVATEPTELMAFFKGDLDGLMTREPAIAARIYKNTAIIIGARLKKTNEMVQKPSKIEMYEQSN